MKRLLTILGIRRVARRAIAQTEGTNVVTLANGAAGPICSEHGRHRYSLAADYRRDDRFDCEVSLGKVDEKMMVWYGRKDALKYLPEAKM